MPSPVERLHGVFELFARPPSKFVTKQYFDLKIEGLSNVPKSGSVVLAANHFSHLDPPLIGIHTGRYVRFMAVDELFGRSKVFDALMNFMGAIPLDRDGYPVRALREAIEHLDGGNIVGLFPEGRRVERWGVDDPKRGAAWLAWMTGAPLIPVAIHGTERTLGPASRGIHRTAVRVWIGESLAWEDFADREDPLGAMTDSWSEFVDSKLGPWWPRVRSSR